MSQHPNGQRSPDGRLLYNARNLPSGEEVVITYLDHSGGYDVTMWNGDDHRWSKEFPDEATALVEFNRW